MEFLIGIIVGVLLCYIITNRKKSSGIFIIDLSDPTNDRICELTMYENLNEICSKKRITLDVKMFTSDSLN